MASNMGLRGGWVKFLADGENPSGMVAQVPDETVINGRGGESPVGGDSDPASLQTEQSYIQVQGYMRKRRGVQSDPT
jgi:hypothetical protein